MNFVASPVPRENMFSGLDIREETLLTFKTEVLVYTLSDLHVDMKGNMEWVVAHCRPPPGTPSHAFTVFVCAGDVSASLDCISRAFKHLTEHYDAVCFVPGNHDCWKRNDVKGDNSVAKLRALLELAAEFDVYMGPLHVYSSELGRGIMDVFPLYSWYHSSWDKEPDLSTAAALAKETECPFHLKWSDFRRCEWPNTTVNKFDFVASPLPCAEPSDEIPSICSMFAELNEPFIRRAVATRAEAEGLLDAPEGSQKKKVFSDIPVITFSHFLPRQECCIEKRFLTEQFLMKVIGSNTLDAQIRALRSDLHIFGHTHIPIDVTVDEQRYLQWPLGYAREATQACAAVRRLNGPLLVFDSTRKGIPEDIPSTDAFWSGYYRRVPRCPSSSDGIPPELVESLKAASLSATSAAAAAVPPTAGMCPCCTASGGEEVGAS